MLGLVPVPEPNAWIGELTGAYLIAGEYLGPCEAARGRARDEHVQQPIAAPGRGAGELLELRGDVVHGGPKVARFAANAHLRGPSLCGG